MLEYIKLRISENIKILGIEKVLEVIEHISNPIMRARLRNVTLSLIRK